MARSTEFEFWEEKVPAEQTLSEDVEFQIQICDEYPNSPPLWTQERTGYKREVPYRREASPWLQGLNHYSGPSPGSRRQAIVDGRQQMLDMIKDMPESAYELSLKDIVDSEQNREELQEKRLGSVNEKKMEQKKEAAFKKRIKSDSGRRVSRSESMESESLQLKMFLPVSMSSRSRRRKTSRRYSEPPSEGFLDWWKMICLAAKRNWTITKTNTSDDDNKTTRYAFSLLCS